MKTNQSLAKNKPEISTNPSYLQLNLIFKRMQDQEVHFPKTIGRTDNIIHKLKNLIFLNFENRI